MPVERELSAFEKIVAGLLLILFTLGSLVLLYGYWPDRLPEKNDTCQNYCKKLFAVRLIDSCNGRKALGKTLDSSVLRFTAKDTTKADTARIDSLRKLAAVAAKQSRPEVVCASGETITLNQLLLLLVALGGFLGNMIYISGAFTAYVGAGTFRRSWILWYFAKPFMASGLALAFYFVFRAGFLNYSNDTSNLNIYGIMSLAMLTGLFTQAALKKLGDVFGFRQDIDGKVKPGPNDVTVTSIEPATIDKAAVNTITIRGQHFDKQALTVSVNGVAVADPDIKPDTITIKYPVPPDQQQATTFTVVVADSKGKALKSREMTAKQP
jgi:hypothetical protein